MANTGEEKKHERKQNDDFDYFNLFYDAYFTQEYKSLDIHTQR